MKRNAEIGPFTKSSKMKFLRPDGGKREIGDCNHPSGFAAPYQLRELEKHDA
jgi:hypothetical protein